MASPTPPPLQKVKTKSAALREAFQERDQAILDARAEGYSIGEIAAHAELTRSGVQGVLARRKG